MPDQQDPIKLVLTPEQREVIHRASGQHVEAVELTPDETQKGQGGVLRFLWRLSAATGIPRQGWVLDNESGEKKKP